MISPSVDEPLIQSAGLNALAVSGDYVATGDFYRRIEVRHRDKTLWTREFRGKSEKARPLERIRGLAMSEPAERLFAAVNDTLFAFNLATGETVWQYTPPRSFGFLIISPVTLDLRGDRLVAAFDNGTMGVWDVNGQLKRLWHDFATPRWLHWLDDDRIIGSDTFSIAVWDSLSGKRQSISRLRDRTYGFDVSLGTNQIALRGLHQVEVRPIGSEDRTFVAATPLGLPTVAFRPDGAELAISGKRHVEVLNLGDSPRESIELPEGDPVVLRYHENALVVADSQGQVHRFSR